MSRNVLFYISPYFSRCAYKQTGKPVFTGFPRYFQRDSRGIAENIGVNLIYCGKRMCSVIKG